MLPARVLIPVFALVVVGCMPFVAICWQRRSTPGAVPLGFTGLGMSIWSLGGLIQLLPFGLGELNAVIGTTITFLGIAILPPAWLTFALQFCGRRVPSSIVPLTSMIGLLTLIASLTNDRFHLLWGPVQYGNETVSMPRPFYWIFVAYAYCLMLTGVLLLWVNGSRQPALFRRRSMILAGAGAIPLMTSAFCEIGLLPRAEIDLTPLAFPFSLGLAQWALFRFRVLEVPNVPLDTLFEEIDEGLVVVDQDDRIVMLNRAGARVLGLEVDHCVGRPASSASPDWLLFRALCHPDKPLHDELTLKNPSGDRRFAARTTPLRGTDGQQQGHLVLFLDVTERWRREREREALLAKLQQAQGELKQLRGLLPICAWCKQIRDKAGHWHRVETYLAAHSEATFTHGLCPDCAKRLEDGMPPEQDS